MQTTLPTRRGRIGRSVAGAALALALPALAGCGFNDQTDQPYQPGVGTDVRDSQVDVLAAVVVSDQPGSGSFIVTLVNNDQDHADKLLSIQGDGVQVATGANPVIPAGGAVNFADPAVGGVPVQGARVKAGNNVTLRLNFQDADPVTVDVPVVTDTGPYAGLAGSTASATPTPTSGASSSPSATASESPAG